MNTYKFLNLQLFATNVTTNNSTGNDLSPEMKTFYEKKLIKMAEPELIFDQFAQKKPIPKNGGKTIEFRKFTPLSSNISDRVLTEGVTPDGQQLDVTALTATVSQYGGYVEVSDMLDSTAIDNTIVEATSLIGGQAGRVLNKVTREVVSAGTNVMYAPKSDGTVITSRRGLDSTCKLTPKLIRKTANILKRQNAPKIDGYYVAVVHPDVATELMGNSDWIDAHKYEASANIFDGEIGKLAGVRFIENTEAKIFKDATCPAFSYKQTADTAYNSAKTYYTKSGTTYTKASITAFASSTTYYEEDEHRAVYACYFLGSNAYGTTEIEGGGLQHIVKPLGSGNDPLNQRATVGWKASKTAEILVQEYLVRAEVCTDDSDSVEAN